MLQRQRKESMMPKRAVLATLIWGSFALPAIAQDAWVVGLTGAMTGPSAGTLGPAVEGLRIYIERLNASGGIAGKPVRLVIQDDSSEPSKAAANTKKLVMQDNVVVLVNTSLSSTYAPMLAETRRAGVPVLFVGSVCPKEVMPPTPDSLQFCTTNFGQGYDSRAALAFIKETTTGPIKIGFTSMAIPISRGEMDYAVEYSKTLGMTPVGHEVIPPPTPDYTPFATKLKDADPNWVFSWAPWVTEVRTIEALRRLGWDGRFITIAHVEAENELPRLKDPKMFVYGANGFFNDKLPIHAEIAGAVSKAQSRFPVEQMTEGWVGGMVIQAALRAVAWPPTPAKVASAMNTLKVDTKGLRGGPLEWTPENHYRTRQYYRFYRWNPDKGAIELVKDWVTYEVK
jgi:ABC-type branched-subunit amino acid transport system substrate-binding protein